MKTSEAVLFGLGGLVIFELLRKQLALGTLNFYPSGIKDFHFDGITPVFTLTLVAQNTSNKDFKLNSLSGNLSANNYLVGNISVFNQAVMITRNAQTPIDMEIRLSLIGIANDVVRAITTGNLVVNMELNSYANIDGVQVPIDLEFKIGV